MIDLTKTQFTSIELPETDAVQWHGKLVLHRFGTFSKAELKMTSDLAALREMVKEGILKGLWEDAYHELRSPFKQLQAAALCLAQKDQDLTHIRELCRQLDELLKMPK